MNNFDKESPVDTGTVDFMVDHFDYLVGKNAHYMLDYIAFCVQNEGKKVMWCPVLYGKSGIGKSYIKTLLRHVMPVSSVICVPHGIFYNVENAWTLNKGMVFIDETPDNSSDQFYNRLKPYITSDTILYRKLYKTPLEIENTLNFFICTSFSNGLDGIKNARRYAVFYSKAEPKSDKYYAHLFDTTVSNREALRTYFQARDISQFDPYAPAPNLTGTSHE